MDQVSLAEIGVVEDVKATEKSIAKDVEAVESEIKAIKSVFKR